MTRGVRSRPLIEPEPETITLVDNQTSDVIDHRQDRNSINGKFAAGNKAAVGRRTPIPFETLLSAHISDEELAAHTAWHIRERHSWEALQYAWDRKYGRPTLAVEMSHSEDDPAVVEARRLADQWSIILQMATPPTLIEAPISQDTQTTE